METTKEIAQAALESQEKLYQALELDIMLLEMEEKQGMMDGIKLEQEWIL